METIENDLKKAIIRNIIYLIIVIGLTALAFYLTIGNNVYAIGEALKQANLWYIVAILGVVLGCILCRSIAIFTLTRINYSDYFFHRSFAIDQIGTLYRMVTPAGLGSHIMETHTFVTQGVRRSSALSILAMYSIVYQIVLILYGVVSIILKRDVINQIQYVFIYEARFPLWVLVGIGFGFNLLTIGFILLLSYWDGFFNIIRGPICKLLFKIHLIKDLERARTHLDGSKVNFRTNLKTLFKNAKALIICVIMFFIYITISYSVPYIAGLSLGNTSIFANYWDSVLFSNIHQMVTAVIPIPGGSGLSEYFFYQLFYPSQGPQFYDSEGVARASLLIWRSLMFIIPLFIASVFTIAYHPRKRLKSHANQENQDLEE